MKRLRLAYFSPLPPERSGIADYSEALLPALAQLADITLFVPQPDRVNPSCVPIRPSADYAALRWQFDLPLYQMGNSPLHATIYQQLQCYGGVVVLHELVLHHFMSTTPGYWREIAYEQTIEQSYEIMFGSKSADPLQSPLNRRTLDLALGILVHSQYARAQVGQTHPYLPCAVVGQPIPPPAAASPLPWRGILGCVGQLTRHKRIDLAVAAFAQLAQSGVAHQLHLLGESIDVDVAELIAQQPPEIRPKIIWHGFTTPQQFQQAIQQLDVVINLREPTLGETSAAALRALAHSKPLVVTGHGWYAELPDSVAVKVRPNSLTELVEAVTYLHAHYPAFSQAASRYIASHASPALVAEQYLTFCHRILQGLSKSGINRRNYLPS